MEKSVLDITNRLINVKQGMTTTDVRDIDGNFVVKLRGLNIDTHFFYTQLPLNEDDDNFEEQLNYINYKITIRKLHGVGWKNSYFNSSDLSMLGYGCGVSRYPPFYDKYFDM